MTVEVLDEYSGYEPVLNHVVYPPVDLHWFFEISIRTEKKIQLELKKNSVIN